MNSRAKPRRPSRRARRICGVLCAALALARSQAFAFQVISPPPAEAPVETTAFSIPETLLVRGLYERAMGHVEARRFGEAIADLQTILEKHEGELLPGERPKSKAGRASEGLVHAGAAQRARLALFGLPHEAVTSYRERHENEAARALAVGRERQDVEALVEVGRRWPLTTSAVRAFVAVGDLELERGNEREALHAWARAIATCLRDATIAPEDALAWRQIPARLASATADPLVQALAARAAWAMTRSDAERHGDRMQDRERGLRLPTADTLPGPLPSERADAWAQPFALPAHPYREPASESVRDALFAVRSGERLYVSNSLRLMCLHAYTGELLWDSGEPRGWSDLSTSQRGEMSKGVDRKAGLVAPAVSDTVVVASLQLPFTLHRTDNFGTIKILTPIPERRLFAFDAATGRKLWDHAPALPWDGETGTLAQRTNAAAPPVIAGSRVLVPCVRMQGRINYHVGCFDLFTGELLWSRDVISGQREQNMFGRSEHEFCAAPLCVEGDKVVALTQLGTIAVLDLFTGEILWETLHETIEIPRSRAFDAPQYPNEWRNAPPLVQEGVIVATPFNSRDLLALDLETGVLLWSLDVKSIQNVAGRSRADVLFGASRDAIYVGGDRWLALHMPAGLGVRGALRPKAESPDDDTALLKSLGGRPVLAQDRIVDPRVNERYDFDRETGARIGVTRWAEGSTGGNVLLGTGEMFVVSNQDVRGYFEWDVLVGRARADLALASSDTTRVLRLARLLDGRGASEWQRGESEAARTHLLEAQNALERVLAPGSPARSSDDSTSALGAVYHSVLRQSARVRAGLADSRGALADLRLARAHAPDAASLRDTLLEELAILGEREDTPGADPAAVAAALSELERSCAELSLQVGARIPNDTSSTPFGVELLPLVAARGEERTAAPEIPIGLWVLIRRDEICARRNDSAGEFAALHAILEHYPDVEVLTWKAGELARLRIESLLSSGARAGYELFEERAQSLYDQGVRAHDDALLRRVVDLYPASRAARTANDARLELALSSSDLVSVARIVIAELRDGFSVETADAQETSRLLRLADAFGRVGNGEARGGLLRALATNAGERASDNPSDAGATLRQLAAAAPRYASGTRAPPRGRFASGTDSASERTFVGDHELLGCTLPDAPEGAVLPDRPTTLVFARSLGNFTTNLTAVDSTDPTAERWSADLPSRTAQGGGTWPRRSAFAAGRVLVAGNDVVVAYESETGLEAWTWTPDSSVELAALAAESGIAVVLASDRSSGERWFVAGLDARTGAELWRATSIDALVQRVPLLSNGRVVLLPSPGRTQVVVLDLFTGSRVRRFDLDTPVVATVASDAWIEGDRLIVPWFVQQSNVERNHVLAYDLATGTRAWRVPLTDARGARWLAGVLQQEGRTWLYLQGRGSNESGITEQSLACLDTRIGALTPLSAVRIGSDDRILGLGRATRVVLPAGPIAVLSPRTGGGRGPLGEARLRAIDLDRGERWVQGLGIPFDELSSATLPVAVASDTILVVVTVPNPSLVQGSLMRADLRAFDLATGQPRGIRGVRMESTKDVPQPIPLGDVLIVRTKTQLEFLK